MTMLEFKLALGLATNPIASLAGVMEPRLLLVGLTFHITLKLMSLQKRMLVSIS